MKKSERAFAKCIYLKGIRFPNTLQSIGKEAFLGCRELYVKPPAGVTIGTNAFLGTKSDTAVSENFDSQKAPKDPKKRIEWLEKYALCGVTEAQFLLGLCYYDGSGHSVDYVRAVECFREAAEKDNREALYYLGYCLAKGLGCEKDREAAIAVLEKAHRMTGGKLSLPSGLLQMLEQCRWERSMEENPLAIPSVLRPVKQVDDRTYKTYVDYANEGSALAKYMLGYCAHTGNGTEKNTDQAMKSFVESAELGCADAMFALGCYCETGTSCQINMEKAVDYYRQASLLGHPDAQYALGLFYDKGEVVEKDAKQAVEWFAKAAEQGLGEAQYEMGLHYGEGNGVERDTAVSMEWYEKAAENGYADAQYTLGVFYGDTELDLNLALKWYRLAAEQDHPEAQLKLGEFYEKGILVGKDLEEAHRLYQASVNQSPTSAAIDALNRCRVALTGSGSANSGSNSGANGSGGWDIFRPDDSNRSGANDASNKSSGGKDEKNEKDELAAMLADLLKSLNTTGDDL